MLEGIYIIFVIIPIIVFLIWKKIADKKNKEFMDENNERFSNSSRNIPTGKSLVGLKLIYAFTAENLDKDLKNSYYLGNDAYYYKKYVFNYIDNTRMEELKMILKDKKIIKKFSTKKGVDEYIIIGQEYFEFKRKNLRKLYKILDGNYRKDLPNIMELVSWELKNKKIEIGIIGVVIIGNIIHILFKYLTTGRII